MSDGVRETDGGVNTEPAATIVVLGLEDGDLDVVEPLLEGYAVLRASGLGMLRQLLVQQKPHMVITGVWIKDGHILETMDVLSETCPHAVVALVVSSVDEDMVAQVQRSNKVLVLQRPLRPLEMSSVIAYGLAGYKLSIRFAEQAGRLASLEQDSKDVTRMKSEFLSLISHELRTPLTEVLGYGELLHDFLKGQGEDKLSEYSEAILRGSHQLQTLIEDLMTLSKAEANALPMEVETFPAGKLVEGDVAAYLDDARARGFKILVKVDERAGIIAGDRRKLMKVLLNLLSNAVKFSQAGGTVGIEISDAGSAVLCKVWDAGKGIKQSRLREIFDAFRQEDSSDRRNRGGLGIGLSIVKHFVSLHGGSVRVTSQPETGTTFSFVIPRRGTKRVGSPGGSEKQTRVR